MSTNVLLFLILSLKCAFIKMESNIDNEVTNGHSQKIIQVETYVALAKLRNQMQLSKQANNTTTTTTGPRLPCSCARGQCGCCTGQFLQSFNQKACMNITYEPDEFAFTAAMYLNGKVLYKNRMSGKNPRPICIRLPRYQAIQVCVRFSNVYFSGANMHTCIDLEADWQDFTVYHVSFDCIRIGASGVAVVPPEEGGGLSGSTDEDDDDDDDDDDYDDNA